MQTIIEEITNTFFPNTLYEGKPGQTLASLIWNHFLKYILGCRSKVGTPIPAIAVHKICSQVNKVLKILFNREETTEV